MRIRDILLTALTVAVISCKDGGAAAFEGWDTAPADLSEVRERCLDALSMDEPFVTDFEGLDIYSYGMPVPGSDYLIPDTITLTAPAYRGAVDRYNSYLTAHNIWSQYDLFTVCRDNGYADPFVNIMENIMGFNTDTLRDRSVKVQLDKAKKALCREIGSTAFGASDENPAATFDKVLEILASEPFISPQDKTWSRAIAEQLSWRKYLDSDYCRLTNGISSKDSLSRVFLDAVTAAPSLEEQCAIALSSVGKVPGEVVLPVMRELLSSGRYTPYQFIMWLGWRSAEQYFFFGTPRDARMAEELYNMVRRDAFLSALRYADTHPSDKTAAVILELFCTTGNIVRNGSYPYGNDAVPDYDMVFGN